MQEPFFERKCQFFGEALPGEAFHHDGVTIVDQRDGFGWR